MVSSAFRYPGSKEKIAGGVLRWFPWRVTSPFADPPVSAYCEPFVGCGAIAMKVLPSVRPGTRVVLGDADPGIVAIWREVVEDPAPLCKLLRGFVPTVGAFEEFKARDGDGTGTRAEIAFRKFALHQISFSGLGAKAGGPIGGRAQRSDYPVSCRFKPERHCLALVRQHKLLKRFPVEVVHGDFADALGRLDGDGFAYLDPPYFVQGGALYKHNTTPDDHQRLARLLAAAEYEWVLSYDDAPAVRAMYGWADIHSFEMVATIETKRGSGTRRKNNELVILPRDVAKQ